MSNILVSSVRSVLYILIPLIFLLISSCSGQQRSVDNLGPVEQQFNNMVGDWKAAADRTQLFTKLQFSKNGDYVAQFEDGEEKGSWEIHDLHHLKLGSVKY